MKKTLWILLSLLLVLLCMTAAVSCGDDVCEHEWSAWETKTAATCTAAGEQTRTCAECETTETQAIAALGHTGGTATCTAKAVCTTCNTAYGELLAHDWNAATCTAAKTCKNCSATEGNALGHTGGTATCTAKAVCTTCNTPYGEALGHTWTNANCTTPKTCSVCAATEGTALGHTWVNATCTTPKTCSVCAATEGTVLAHDWNAATCTAPKTCKNCPATEGEALGHTGERTTCNVQAICTRCHNPFGEAYGHVYNLKNTAAIYVKSAATCEAPASYYYSCACGEKSTESFTDGEALNHNYTYESNGDGTHTATCLNDPTHTKDDESCSGGEATCDTPAECAFCEEAYGEPAGHNWVADPAPLSGTSCTEDIRTNYTCSTCQATKTEIEDAPGHSYEDAVTPPTCAVPGYTTHTCTECGDSYTDTPVAATGAHDWDADRTCTTGHSCNDCGTTEPALGHSYNVSATPATCTAAAFDTFTCSVCDDEYTVVTADALGHNIAGVTPTEVSTEGCDYQQYYKCNTCGEDIKGDIVTRHKYVASVIDATCKTGGATVLTCSVCNDTQSTPIPADGTAHLWSTEGTKSGDKLIYECTVDGCDETKSVVDLSDKSEGELNVEDVTSNGVEFKDATMDVSQLTGEGGVLNGAEKVTLAAGKLEGSDLEDVKSNLDEKQLEQIGDNPIFNFTMTDADGNPISQFGDKKVTITVPYDPKTMGGDVDNIAIWFIADDGTLTAIEATYHNGFVTFQTNHFSRYTVTRLTPEERCALYGHNWATKAPVPATCTTAGYTLRVCIRCTLSEKYDIVDALGHSYVEASTEPAGCTTAGKIVYDCENCSHSYETAIPATGHSYVSETVPATCADFGTTTYTCGNCADRYTETLPNLSHEMDSEITAPTCEESGYTTYFCVNCSYYYNGDYTKALGHSLVDTWEWTDNESATVTLSCDREGCEHVFTEEVAATSKTWSSTCKKEGRTVYTAKYVYNGVTYTDTQTVPLPLANHEYDTTKLLHDANGHWYRCGFCGAAGEAQAHVWNAGTVTKAPTCVAKGEKTFTCECGEIKTEEIPVTTTHRYTADNVCQDCGHKFVCEHTYNAGEIISQSTCAVAGAKRFTCTKCGATKTEALPLDESTHVWNSGEITTAPTCAAEGVKTFTCSVCNGTKTEAVAIDANAHAFGEGVITTAPTCVAAGVKTFTCTHNSAHTKTEAVAATGEHTYADGKCTQCGKIETACDHSELTRTVVVDLSKHGVCGGTLSYLTCECGEIAVLTEDMFEMMEGMALGCEHITQSNETEGEDEDGNEFGSVDFSCADCGLVVTATFTEIVDGCRGIDRLSLLFKVNGTAIMPEIVCEEVWEEHDSENYETEIIDLTKYGACGGTLEIMKCGDCGATIDLEKPAAPDCTGEWIEIMPENESGEYKLYFACTECGLVIDVLAKAQTVNCQRFMIAEFMISCGDTVIFELEMKQSMGYTEHNWVGSAELAEGKTCEDGFVLTLTCADCGTSFTYSYNEHMPAILDREIDLTEHGACEGSIKFYTCPCGAYEDVYVDSCANYNGSNSYEDEDGTPHYVYIYSCEKCGLAYMEGYSYLREGCTENEYYFIAVGIGEETVILEPYTYLYSSYEDHNYLYEFELEGDSCEDGFTYTATCVDCGAVDAGSGTQHSPVLTAYYDLAKHDACGGYIEIHSCACGKEGWMNFEIPCDYSQDSHVYEGTDGYLHDVSTYTCQKCGLSFTTDSYAVPEGCYAIHYTTLTISVGENVVEEGYTYVSEHEDRHDYEYEFELYGESCEDGYFYTATCKVCGYTESGENYWHQAFDQAYYDLTEYGICGGYIAIYACACGEESGSKREVYSCDCTYETSSYNKDGIEHSVETRTCQKCGMVYVEDRYLVPDGCCEYVYTTITIKKDDVTVIKTVEFNDGWYDHHEFEYEFELMGESCEDGVHLYGYCKVCGEYKNFYRDWHDYEHGVCTLCGAPAPECEHLWMEGDISAPTCSENGVATYTCAYCGDTMTETVPATGEHTYEDGACTQCGKAEPECEHQFDEGTVTLKPTCVAEGAKLFTCAKCGETKSESIAIDKDAHAFDEGKVTTEPTCVASGIKTYTCALCAETKTESVDIDKDAHAFDEGKVTTAPTCVASGIKTYTCALCAETKTESVDIDKDAHAFDEGKVTTAPTCVASGIKTYTCTVCGETKTEAVAVDANAHTWVDATCEAPKTCSVCKATEGEALGHTWVDATCEAPKTCKNCSATEGEALGHTWVDTVTAPTCTEAGYTTHVCSACNKTVTDTPIPATGNHTYENGACTQCGKAEPECEHQFDEGTVTLAPTCTTPGTKFFTCELCGETKSESIAIDKDAHAFDEGKVTTAPTCVASGIKTYTCALCAETKTESVDIDKDAHAWNKGEIATAPTCSVEGVMVFTCQLCDEFKTEAIAVNKNAHEWNEGEITLAPTCAADGVMTYTCASCGESKTEIVPATGEHTYEDGACTQCGKVEGACDHSKLTRTVTVDFAEFGACGGVFSYLTCDCGEIAVLTVDSFDLLEEMHMPCNDHIVVDEEKEWEDEDGNEYWSRTAHCEKCGMVQIMTEVEIEEDCLEIERMTIQFLMDDTPVMPKLVMEYVEEYHHYENYESEIIDLTEYGACGGTLEIMKCGDCGMLMGMDEPNAPNCKGEWIEDMQETADGVEYVMYFACTECGLVIDAGGKMYVENCETVMVSTVLVTCGDTVIFELEMKQSMGYAEHEWVVSAELAEGKSCEDGYLLTSTCPNCGISLTFSYNEHMTFIRNTEKEIDLTEFGACEGSIQFYTCPCGEVETAEIDCCAHEGMGNSYEDENGNRHDMFVYTCSKCGLAYMEDRYTVREGCSRIVYYTYAVAMGESIVVEEFTVAGGSYEDHNYLYEFTLNGDSCEDGFTYTATCADCGAVRTGSGKYHNPYLTAYYDLSEYGICGGSIEIHSCACGKESWTNTDIACETTWDSTSYEKDGVLHQVDTRVCRKCGMTYVRDTYQVSEGCYLINHATLNITVGETEVIKDLVYVDGRESRHDYEYEVEMDGASCEDGYYYYATCKVCGETDSGYNKWHDSQFYYAYYDLAEYGACGGYIEYRSCACGAQSALIDDVACEYESEITPYEKDGVLHALQTVICRTCGLTITTDAYQVQEGCYESIYGTITIKVGEQTVVENLECVMFREENHDYEYTFELMGDSCEDGLRYQRICKTCGYGKDSSAFTYSHETFPTNSIDLAEYGACGGSIDFYACPCGKLSRVESNFECELQYCDNKLETDEDGIEHWVETATCANCGLQYVRDDYTVREGCVDIRYRTISVTVGENVVLEPYKFAAERIANHTYEYRFEMYGESCEDGYVAHISCKNCDYSRTEEFRGHKTYESYHDLTKYGACGGYIRMRSCPCGENGGYPDYSFACNFSEAQTHTYVGEDGFTHTVSTWVCEDCGLTRTEDHYTVKEGCNLVNYRTMTVTVDGITVVDLDGLRSWQELHEYDYNFIMQGESCEDGYTYTRTCKNCDYYEDRTWETYYYHQNFPTKYYDFSQYSACGSYLYEYACPCGQYNGISTNFYSCDLSYEWDNYTDDSGVSHEVEISTCQKCGLVFTRDRYAVREGCFDVYYCALTVTSGDVTLLDNLFYKERSEERHQSIYELTLNEGATSCEDGYTVVEKCAKCGYASEPWENSGWHTSYCVEYYDLAPYTACGGYVRVMSCACGETHYFDHNIYCEFESEETEYKDADGRKHTLYTNTCTACGLVWEQDHYTVREGCFDVHYVEYTFTVDGTAVISALKNVDGRSERHEYDYTFHLNGKSCNDGYTYVAVCKSCDYSREGEGSWHTTYTMETYYLAEHGACGGYLERYTCACGESSGISWNIECDYEYEETSFEENGVTHDVYTYTCAACGLKLVENWYTLREGCYDNTYVEMTVTVGDTVVVDGMKARNDYDTYHKLAYTFQLNDGVSCENGYTYVATCQNCDYVTDGSGSSHNTYTTERYDLAEYGACGGEISLYTCACGKSKGVWSNLNCHYNSSTVENVVDGITHSVTTYVCNNCALVRVYDAYTVREGCYYVTYYALTVKVGDNVPVNNYEYVYNRSECHDYTYSFTVGASCEDGYSYTAACKNCGDTREGGGYGHNTYRTQYYFLEDYGVCGGYVQYYTCACGYSSRISTSFDCDYTSSNSSYEDANGVTHSVDTYACADCGMTRVSDYHTVTEGCYDIRYCDFTLVMGEETVVDTLRYVSSRSSNHDLSYTLTLKDGATTCVDGYVASFRCKNCDYTGTEYGYSHNSYPIERYNLKDFGACGGYVEIRECACGENSYVNTGWHCNTNYTSNTYVDEDGYTHRVSTSTCNSCEMRYTEDSYAVKAADSCETTTYHTVMMNVGGTLVCDYRYTTTDTVHDYKVTGTTEDGVTCENGVTLTYECRYCDHSYTNHYTYHAEYELERVALDCDCGGYAAIRGCACGYYVSLDLSNWLCDEGWTYTDAFVDNIVPEDYYRVPNGNRYIDNEFGIYTCAVTDPVRCAYKIRVARYYVMEGDCRAAYCVKYQFGYDEETGTCDYEYTLKTTQLETVHTFTETEISENENGLIVTGTKYTCENCGSYYYEKNYYDAALGKSVKNEYYFENKLDDGNYAFYHTVTEYDYTFDAGFGVNTYAYTQTTSYPGYSRVEKRGYTYYREYNFTMYEMTVYNRGTADETWSRYDYTYSFEGSCTRTTVFTNSAGTRTESTEEYHRSTTRKTDKNSTCTQDGAYHDECVFCEKTTYEGIYNPNGHSWVKLADEYYVCGHCGLENTNGVSGSIVMEDLTRTLGNGENYVVGYWNKTLVKFQYYVCLYLNEPNEYGDYQVDLTGITVNKLDGTRGYAFSKAEVAAAAKALGYEADEYDVMFVFVPEGADSSFDYAIIFSEDEAPAEVSESTAFTTYLETNEIITITIKPAESGMWTFRFADYHDTYIQLLDAEGNFLTSSVYGAYMEYELTAGETYQLQIKWATYYDYAFCYIGVGITAPDAA